MLGFCNLTLNRRILRIKGLPFIKKNLVLIKLIFNLTYWIDDHSNNEFFKIHDYLNSCYKGMNTSEPLFYSISIIKNREEKGLLIAIITKLIWFL
jgi:hypothetical protein